MAKSKERRRQEAEERNRIAQERPLEEKLAIAVQRGHEHSKEAKRLRKLLQANQ